MVDGQNKLYTLLLLYICPIIIDQALCFPLCPTAPATAQPVVCMHGQSERQDYPMRMMHNTMYPFVNDTTPLVRRQSQQHDPIIRSKCDRFSSSLGLCFVHSCDHRGNTHWMHQQLSVLSEPSPCRPPRRLTTKPCLCVCLNRSLMFVPLCSVWIASILTICQTTYLSTHNKNEVCEKTKKNFLKNGFPSSTSSLSCGRIYWCAHNKSSIDDHSLRRRSLSFDISHESH